MISNLYWEGIYIFYPTDAHNVNSLYSAKISKNLRLCQTQLREPNNTLKYHHDTALPFGSRDS